MERLTGVIQPYAWGSLTTIPEFLGVEATGQPQAELWFGAHPLAPSMLDGEPLDKVVAQDPVGVVGRGRCRSVWGTTSLPTQGDRRGTAALPAGSPLTHAGRGRIRA